MKIRPLKIQESGVVIPHGNLRLPGDLNVPATAVGIAIFAHGSGSSRRSPRNQSVAWQLQRRGIGTLLFDLLTDAEEQEDLITGHLRFNIPLLAERLAVATQWVIRRGKEIGKSLPIGYFGSSTGAAAALMAAAEPGNQIQAIVSRGGRPDLAGEFLSLVKAPTLLIVGANDAVVIELNEQAREQLRCPNGLAIVPRATHLFSEPGALEEVSRLAGDWFLRQFANRNAMAA